MESDSNQRNSCDVDEHLKTVVNCGATNDVHNCVTTLVSLTHLQQMQIASLQSELESMTDAFYNRHQVFANHLNRITLLYCGVKQQLQSSCEANASLTVNGSDLSKIFAGNDEAVLSKDNTTSDHPITVDLSHHISHNNCKDVCKQTSSSLTSSLSILSNRDIERMESDLKSESNGSLRSYREIATQTEWTCGWNGWEFPPPFIFPYPTPNKTQMASFLSDNALVGKPFLDLNNEDDDDDDDDDGCDVEYEEITLHLNTLSDRLGLSFVGADDQTNDVLVTEIEAESVAAKDGRIQEGDQILQVNGIDVRNSSHAIELFSRCLPSEFTVFVCRAPAKLHEAYTYIQQHHQSKLDKCQYSPLHYHNHVVGNIEELLVDDANVMNGASLTLIENNFLEKDSGVGRTDESTKNDESCAENDKLSINNGTMDSGHSQNSQNTSETSTTGDNSNANESQLKCEVNTVNKDVCNAYNYSGINDINSCVPLNIKQFSSDTSLDREMALLHQEMQSIQLECESLINKRLHQNQVKQNNVAIDDNFHYQNRQKYIQHTYMNLDDIRPNVSPNSSLINKSREKSAHNNEKNFNCETTAEQTINGNKLNSITSSNSNQRSNLPKEKKESVERWIKNMPTSTSTSTSTPVSNRKATKFGFSKPNMCEDKERDSSSAYNTGESSRSTPLTLELTPLPVASVDSKQLQNDNSSKCYYRPMMSLDLVSPCKGMEDKSTQLHESDVASIWSCESCRRCCRSFLESRETLLHQTQPQSQSQPSQSQSQNRVTKRSSSESSSKPSPQSQSPIMRKAKCDTFDGSYELSKNRNYVRMYPTNPCNTTMYTNEANLEHTIWLQQQLFREALAAKKQFTDRTSNNRKQQYMETVSHKPQMSSFPNIAYSSSKIVKDSNFMSTFGISVPPSPSKSAPLTSTLKANNENNIKMEWKVKRRPDGTRYITRRPVRNKILKERALKIMEERCSGLTTDDDAISELKIGRYWPKDERKRHFEKSRARKREIMMRTTKMAALREHSEEREIANTNNGSLARNLTQYRDSNTKRNKLTEIVRNSNSTSNSSNSAKQLLSNGILSVTTV